MSLLSPFTLIWIMILTVFILGLVTFSTGLLILALYANGRDVRNLATQTAHMAQKGIAEDLATLVGHASELINTLNQLVRTTTGIGVFLVVLGILQIGLAVFLAIKFYQMPL